MNKELIRDRIAQLEFRRSSVLNKRQRELIILLSFLSIMVIFFIFEIEHEKRLEYIIGLGLILILSFWTIPSFRPKIKEEELIEKNYRLLLSR